MSLQFRRTVENFICGHCGQSIIGNGYTNHCPACLYSRHVDVHPGERASACGALMEPLRVEMRGQDWMLVHHCVKCGFERRNKVAQNDDASMLLKLNKLT